MAVNLFSDNSGGGLVMSPRISFSHNLCQADISHHHHQQQQFHRSDSTLLESSCDFDFCISESFKDEESSTADELFSDGKLLPLQIREKLFTPRQQFHDHQSELPPLPPPPSRPSTTAKTITVDDDSKKESLKEIMGMSSFESTTTTEKSQSQSQSQSKSFWRFKRSASMGNGGYKRSLICSLPLLSRSNSTGSTTPNPKRTPSLSKDNSKNLQKPPSSKSPYHYHPSSSSSQKPPLKKNYGSYNNGVRISPVLNVPPPYISKGTASLFGLGSFFCNGKDKNKKK